MGHLHFQPQTAHRVEVDGRDLLFHIPTTALFEIDALDGEVLRIFADRGRVDEGEVKTSFAHRALAEVAERRFGDLGEDVNFTLATNAALLTPDIVDWLDAHRFGLTVSMDGPKTLHDLNRKTIGGKGSYGAASAKARMLPDRHRSRPICVRSPLTAGGTQVERIWDHLKNDIGFAEVGLSPVTSGDMAAFNLSGAELAEMFTGMKSLGRRCRDQALAGNNIGFSNMHHLMQDMPEGRSKALPCGAGVGLLAVDHEGGVNLCRRFTGSDLERCGAVQTGLKHDRLAKFIEARADRTDKGCAIRRIRNICAGGCYHESDARFSDPLPATCHYCDLMRDWVDFGDEVCGDLIARAPLFLRHHIAPRRANHKRIRAPKRPSACRPPWSRTIWTRSAPCRPSPQAAPPPWIPGRGSPPSAASPPCASRSRPIFTAAPTRAGGPPRRPTPWSPIPTGPTTPTTRPRIGGSLGPRSRPIKTRKGGRSSSRPSVWSPPRRWRRIAWRPSRGPAIFTSLTRAPARLPGTVRWTSISCPA